jgi:uncharacterized protein YdaU (DUF1376 family)
MHFYSFNIKDFVLHTAHLTLEEEAVYRRLLDCYYDTESPIPKETQSVIRRLRLGSYVDQVDQILSEFFHLEDDGYHNNRADIEIAEYRKKADVARENGKKGGRPKKNKGPKTQSVILANPEETTSKATIKQEPVTIKERESKIPVCPHEEIVGLYHKILPELPMVRFWKEDRRKLLLACWKQGETFQDLRFWEWLFTNVKQDDFYMGRQGGGTWTVTLPWLVNKTNFMKAVEKYSS